MLLKGGSGRNTIKGTAGLDVIEGGKNDVLLGNDGVDIIVANDGKDSIEGGDGADSIMLGLNLTFQDTVKGGEGSDILSYKAASATTTNDLDNVTEIETIKLEDVDTKIVTKESLVATDKTVAISFTTASTTKTLNLDASAEDGNGEYDVTGGAGNDTITGGDGDDTIAGAAGIDVIDLDAGTSVLKAHTSALAADRDVVTNFTVGTDVLSLDRSKTTVAGNANATAVIEDEAIAANNADTNTYNIGSLTAGNTNTLDIITIDSTTLTNIGNADLSAATDGTELLKALVVKGASTSASGITFNNSGDELYILTDDGTNGYLYYADSDGDAEATASEIALIGTFGGSLMDGVAAAQTIMY